MLGNAYGVCMEQETEKTDEAYAVELTSTDGGFSGQIPFRSLADVTLWVSVNQPFLSQYKHYKLVPLGVSDE
jgi:hypothetical protein